MSERPPVRLTVPAEDDGLRLDAFLCRQRAAASIQAAKRLVGEGRVRVDGRAANKGARLVPGQVVEVQAAAVAPAPTLSLEVIFCDEHLVAINKPPGVPSHRLREGEGETVADALVARFPECATASEDPREGGLGHRLDVGTSGVLLAARDREAWSRLRSALAEPGCEKMYRAEVRDRPRPEPGDLFVESGPGHWVVTVPIGRSGRRGERVRLGSGRGLLPSRTEVRLLQERGARALVEARLSKGRAHQVRAHLAYLGCAVIGDELYGGGEPDGLRLHAWRVRLRHPITGKSLEIEAPLPAWAHQVNPPNEM